MRRPIRYLQTDARWKKHNYSAPGETRTIGSSGCGITAAAMVIATLKDATVTPVVTAEWSMARGYKAKNQGTYYSYFVPQMQAYGITCKRLNTSNLYGKSTSEAHTQALAELKKGNWIIACMGKGLWTKSGHYILVYGYENGNVYINDPASVSAAREQNTWQTFAKQVKYMWVVETTLSSEILSSPTYNRTEFIKEVQAALGTRIDGIAGPETLSKTITVSAKCNRKHPVVVSLQKYLTSLGYDCGSVDGIAGQKFTNAVIAYQKAHNCMADGIISKKARTWKSLLGLM